MSSDTDLNAIEGKYLWTKFSDKPLNAPDSLSEYGGILFHIAISDRNKVQVMFEWNSTHMYFRTFWGTTWKSWKSLP